jgi:acyl-CoA thioester hydrolase
MRWPALGRRPEPVSHELFQATYRVRFDEAGPDGTLRTSGFLRYAQDVAWQHSEALGFDRAWYAERRLTWLVRGAEIEVSQGARMGSNLDVSTEVLGYRKVWARRRSEIRLNDGSLAARVNTDWLLIDAVGRPTRVPSEISHLLAAPIISTALARVDTGQPSSTASVRRFTVRPQELDPLDHVNNAVYLDWLEEGIREAGEAPTSCRQFRLEYAAAAEPDAELERVTWPHDGGWAHHVRRGDVVLFRALAGP